MSDENAHPRSFPHIIPDEAVEHAWRARDEIRKSVAALLPSVPAAFTTHRLAARKEMLLAFRSLIDHAIDRVEKTEVKPVE